VGKVLILSPHCDDIAFSLGASMMAREWGDDVTGVVIFSESRYSLSRGWDNDVSEQTAVRNDEERAAAALGGYRVEFLAFPEPGVRPGYTQVTDIFSSDLDFTRDPVWESVDERLRARLAEFDAAGGGTVLSPLGVGRHVDHRITAAAFRAALPRLPRVAPAFYEDLPYVARFTSQEIRRLVPDDLALRPVLFSRGNLKDKLRVLRVYESQVSADDYDSVAAHWDCRGRTELVWMPEQRKS
jgi:LmbE family N-acetylglucosaminyl deacetylase